MLFVELLRSGNFWHHRVRFRFSIWKMAGGFVLDKGWFDLQKNLQSLRCGGGDECCLSNFLRSGDFWHHRVRFRFSLREMGGRFRFGQGRVGLSKKFTVT